MRLDSGTCDRSAPEGGTSTGVGAVGSSFRNSSGASSGVGALICVVQTVWCNCSCGLVAQSSAFFVSSAFRRAVSSAFSLLRRCPLVSSTMTAEGLRGRNISSSVIGRLYSGVSDWQGEGGAVAVVMATDAISLAKSVMVGVMSLMGEIEERRGMTARLSF